MDSLETSSGPLVLSTHRVWKSTSILTALVSSETWVSLAVARVEWTKIERHHAWWLLLASALVCLGGVWLGYHGENRFDERYLVWSLLVAGVLLVVWFVTRTVVLTLGAGVGSIRVRIRGGGAELDRVRNFIDRVEAASSAARGAGR